VRFVNGISQYGQSFTPVTTQALSAVPSTVLLMNMTSSGNTYGIIPYTSTDFTLNLFGQSVNTTTISGAMKLNVWQHIALVRSGQTTTLYINGVASAATVYPWWTNGTVTVFFGGVSGTYANYFQGQISNFRVVMGTAVYTTNFTPQTTPLTAIQGTALLTMNSSTVTDSAGVTNLTNNNSVAMSAAAPFQANVSIDYSGNNNNWFVNNVGMTSSTLTYDIMPDVPADSSNTAANWSVLSVAATVVYGSITNGSLTFVNNNSAHQGLRGTQTFPTSGKFYFEGTITSATAGGIAAAIGIATIAASLTQYPGAATGAYAIYASSVGFLYFNGSQIASIGAFAAGAVLQVAYDTATGNLWLGVNNSWYDIFGGTTGNPSTGANPTMALASSLTLYPYLDLFNNTMNVNFGQLSWAYTPPTGFGALNTFTAASYGTWWGNSNSYPDLTWIKSRSNTTSHMLMDTVRGPSLYLNSDTTNPQFGSGGAYNWSKYGLVLANDGNTNVAGNTYVLWGWTAGQGNTVVNGSGSISSTVSANPVAGFSIVTYPGNGSPGTTVGHGLNVTPAMVMIKGTNSSTGGSNWLVWHQSISQAGWTNSATFTTSGITSILLLNATNAALNYTFDAQINGVGGTYVAYCWAAVPGYSAFGSYTGNGATDGPFIYTGFRPRWIMYKSTTEVSYWNVFDTARSTYNVDGPYLNPNVNSAEGSTTLIDIISNGFKLRTSSSGNNTSSATYIYAAFAENPFKYALAR
jgi:hypothetical protein